MLMAYQYVNEYSMPGNRYANTYIYIYIFRNCGNLDVILKACMKQKLCFSQHSNPIQPKMLRIDQCNCDFPIDKSNSNAMTFIRHEKRAVKRSSLNHTEYVVK